MATLKAKARVSGGIQTASDANANPADTTAAEATVKTFGLSTAQWVMVLTGGAAAFLLLTYFGYGGTRGYVL